MTHEWHRDGYTISDDQSRLDLDVIHGFLARSYWATGVPRDAVERSIEHSLNLGLYGGDEQIGYARVVTDYARFAYLADVFVLEEHRGNGLGIWLVESVIGHPGLQGLQRWMLGTADAHSLYEKVGFVAMARPERFMEIAPPDFYTRRHEEGR
jgi:GNAT superfamily N-acetyltransferase